MNRVAFFVVLISYLNPLFSQENDGFFPLAVNKFFLQNSVTGIEKDERGKLWFATHFGLYNYDGYHSNHFAQYNVAELKSNRISGVYNVNGAIWVEDDQSFLYRVQNERLYKSQVPLVLFLNNGYFAKNKQPKANYEKIQLRSTITDQSLAPRSSEYLTPDSFFISIKDSRIDWRWTNNSGCVFKTKLASRLVYKSKNILVFMVDSHLRVYKKGESVCVYDVKIPDYLREEINCVYPDLTERKIFIGTSSLGVLYTNLIADQFYPLDRSDNRTSPYAYSYCLNNEKSKLYSLVNTGLYVWPVNQQTNGVLLSKGSWTGSFCKTDPTNNYVWFSQDFKLKKLNISTSRVELAIPFVEKTPIEDVFWLNGKMYFVSHQSIYSLDNSTIVKKVKFSEFRFIQKVKVLNNLIYLCTENGLFVVDANWKCINKLLSGITIRDICKVNGDLYVATYGMGVKVVTSSQRVESVPNDPFGWLLTSHGIRKNSMGELLISTNRGIVVYQPKNKQSINDFQYRFISARENLGCNELNGGVYPESEHEPLFFASNKGVFAFDPNTVLSFSLPPKFSIGTITIDGRAVNHNSNAPLKLGFNYQYLKVDLDFVDFSSDDKSRIFYRVKELGVQWSAINPNRSIVLNRLPFGTYHLEFYNGVESRIVLFEVSRPFFQKWWFIAIVSLLSVGLIWLYFYLKFYQKIKQQKLLEKMVYERTVELNRTLTELETMTLVLKKELDFKNKLYAILMHDLKSPLLFLSQSILITLSNEKPSMKGFRSTLNVAAQSAHDLFHFINEFLQWLGTQFEGFKPDISSVKPASLLQEILKIYHPIAELNGISIMSNYLNFQGFSIETDKVLLGSILRNLIDNAIKFNQGDFLQINLEEVNGHFCVTLTTKEDPDGKLSKMIMGEESNSQEVLQVDSAMKMGWKIMFAFSRLIQTEFKHEVVDGTDRLTLVFKKA